MPIAEPADPGINADRDTIAAVATPPGRGGISIVRLSGPASVNILEAVTGRLSRPRSADYCQFLDREGQAIDQGIVLLYSGPASYTGEDVVELQGHGSPVVMQQLLARCVELGARLARPGEFSERAFLNGRMDLAQAEAVADLIDSHTRLAARAAMNSLAGGFSKEVHQLEEAVVQLRIFVEAAIDFPDEEIDFLEEERVVDQLEHIADLFDALKSSTAQGKILRDGVKIVLTGLPNAGKSSLLNSLSNEDRAIVSAIAGTTRDTLEQFIDIDGLAVEVIDTAGIRDTRDEIEAEGVRRARAVQDRADMILLVVDDNVSTEEQIAELENETGSQRPLLVVRNKCDLSGRTDHSDHRVAVSALTGQGMDELRQRIKTQASFNVTEGGVFLARQRHVDALDRAHKYLLDGLQQQVRYRAAELLADDLTACHRALGEITGEVSSDDLLGMIFSSFCIGK